MQVSAGFDGKYKENRWFPVTIQLTNGVVSNQISAKNISEFKGILTISTTVSRNKNAEYIKEIQLPALSSRRYYFYVKDPLDSKIDISIKDNKGNEISSNSIVLNRLSNYGKLILLIGTPETQIYFNTSNHFNGVDSVVVKPELPNLPDKWFGYNSIDLLIISDFQKKILNEEQMDAIKKWVQNGGKLIVSVGSKWQLFKDSFIEEMLPVKITDSSVINTLKIFNEELSGSEGDIVISNSELKKGLVINQNGEKPLIVKGKYGSGEVYYLAFDIDKFPFRGWNGQDKFWLGFLGESSHYKFTEFAIGYFRNFISKIKYLEPPKIETIGIILLLYLILVCPINFFILRKKKKLELAWVTIPIIVVIFSISIYFYGLLQRGGNLILRNVSIINTSEDSTYGRVNGASLLFTPKRNKFDIQIKNKDSIISEEFYWGNRMEMGWTSYPRRYPKSDFESVQTLDETDEVFLIKSKPMKIWTTVYLEYLNQIDLGGFIDADLKISSDSLYGTIKNKTKYKIKDCMFLCGITGEFIGDLDSGKTIEVKYTMKQIEGFKSPNILYSSQSSRTTSLLQKEEEEIIELKKELLSNLFINSKLELSRNGIIAIVGWIEGELSSIDVGRSIGRKENINLLIAELDCKLVPSDILVSGEREGFYLPVNLISKTLVDYKADSLKFSSQSNLFFSSLYVEPIRVSNGYVIYNFAPSFDYDKIRLLNASITPNISNIESAIYNFETNEWENIILSSNTPLKPGHFNPERSELWIKLSSEKTQQPYVREGQISDLNISFTGLVMK